MSDTASRPGPRDGVMCENIPSSFKVNLIVILQNHGPREMWNAFAHL